MLNKQRVVYTKGPSEAQSEQADQLKPILHSHTHRWHRLGSVLRQPLEVGSLLCALHMACLP